MEINKLKILYDAIIPVDEVINRKENPTKEDVQSCLNFAVHYMETGLDGVLDAMKNYARLHVRAAIDEIYEKDIVGNNVLSVYPESNIE